MYACMFFFFNQKEAISGTISHWHLLILLRILTVQNEILIFFEGYLQSFWMDFRSDGTRRSVKLSTFLLQSLKAERCDFLGKNRSGAGALSKQGFLPRNSKRRTQNPSKSLKELLLRQKDDSISQLR